MSNTAPTMRVAGDAASPGRQGVDSLTAGDADGGINWTSRRCSADALKPSIVNSITASKFRTIRTAIFVVFLLGD